LNARPRGVSSGQLKWHCTHSKPVWRAKLGTALVGAETRNAPRKIQEVIFMGCSPRCDRTIAPGIAKNSRPRGAIVRDQIERHDASLGLTLSDRTILPSLSASGRLKSATSFPGAVRNNDPLLKRTNRLGVYSGCPPRVESRRDSPETAFFSPVQPLATHTKKCAANRFA